MTWAKEVTAIAEQMEGRSRQRDINIREYIAGLERSIAKAQATLAEKPYFPGRLQRFKAEIAGAPQCPQCWIRDEKRTALAAADLDGGAQRLTCPVCAFSVSLWPKEAYDALGRQD